MEPLGVGISDLPEIERVNIAIDGRGEQQFNGALTLDRYRSFRIIIAPWISQVACRERDG